MPVKLTNSTTSISIDFPFDLQAARISIANDFVDLIASSVFDIDYVLFVPFGSDRLLTATGNIFKVKEA